MATEINKEIQQLLAEGYHQFKNRQFTSANLTYNTTLQKLASENQQVKNRYYTTLVSLRGLTETQLKFTDKALDSFNQVLQKDPLNVGTLLRRAMLYMKKGQYNKSWNDLQQGLILQPDNQRIQFFIEQLNEKTANLRQGDSTKYSIKQEISEMVKFPEIEQDMLLNFSQLKLIDKQSSISSKSVSIKKQPTATIEIQKQFDMNILIAALVKEVVLSPQQIRQIQKQTQLELQPKRLEEQLIQEMKIYQPVKIQYDRASFVSKSSILKSKLQSSILSTTNRNSQVMFDQEDNLKRVSALQVKNIDGKVVKSRGQDAQDDEDSDQQNNGDVGFGGVQDIQQLQKKQPPIYKNQALKRKSSIKKGKSITMRDNEKSQFSGKGINLLKVNIDKPFVKDQNDNTVIECSQQIQRVKIDVQASEIDSSSQYRNSNVQTEELESPVGIGLTGLKRQSSILKSKRKYQDENQSFKIELN